MADAEDTDDLSYLTPQASAVPGTTCPAQPGSTQETSPVAIGTVSSTGNIATVPLQTYINNINIDLSSTVEVLQSKIQWATEELRRSESVEYSLQLCHLVKGSAEALLSLKML